MREADLAHCREAIRHGSLSFHAASRLLPREVRDPALVLYAFCRLADDAVDLTQEKAAAVLALRDRLDLAYAGTPRDAPADRAFAEVIREFEMPRALPEALLEGLAWDAEGRSYATLSELRAYSARVASAVGAMMCVLMRVRDGQVLARACDLGVAMQLTNIARDVGEDAREGRLYLPRDWLDEAGIDPDRLLADPRPDPALCRLVRRLHHEAEHLYARSEAGVQGLPRSARPGIFAARYIYAGIGGRLRAQGFDSITRRARTSKAQKAAWLALATLRAGTSCVLPRSALIYAPPLRETAFLVDAAAHPESRGDWSDGLLSTFSQLAERDAARRAALLDARRRATSPA
ncbi:15-cis-phytoene synthase [Pseudoponticoccus marisrubri]|uniref:Phytoene synthase n=1 Tax=Pseudoponticoccus marisrubri TaxID=1685382 RepID=A0A0W7WHE6_9RHOB|nr:phytoene/squalene synthase family protein [Pseudoponticoccus marisrubri]KUF10017.1 phytoene synthase [Pseudoponticoccus marisrubri]